MTHEAKTATNEEVEKISEQVILVNKTFLHRLQTEEEEELQQKKLVVGEELEDVGLVSIHGISETGNTEDYQKVTINDFRTQTKKNKLELST